MHDETHAVMREVPWQVVFGAGLFFGYVLALSVREFKRGLRGSKRAAET